jgi:hypothetical protein
MRNNRLPKSDLAKLQREVLALPPSAALPCNLPEHWLDMIARDLEATMTGGEEGYASAPLLLVVHILQGKTPGQSGQEIQIPLETLYDYFRDLRVEIDLEIVNRRTRSWIEPATLDSIFTDRMVLVVPGGASRLTS